MRQMPLTLDSSAEFFPTGDSDPFRPFVRYEKGLNLLIAQAQDRSIVVESATKLHCLDVGYNTHPSWWRKLLGIREVCSIQIWSPVALAKHYGIPITKPFPLATLVWCMSLDPELGFTWSTRERRRAFRFLNQHTFSVDCSDF